VGAGRIGSQNDAVANPAPLSHVGAVLATTGLELAAIVDPSPEARRRAEAQWREHTDAKILPTIDCLAAGSVDIITLCTPTAQRSADVKAVLSLRPRLLIVEKPLAPTLSEAEVLHRLCAAEDVSLRVNFNRRFDPATRQFRQQFADPPAKIVLRYGKGLFNYASHMVDLLQEWYGPVNLVQAVAGDVQDGTDPNLDFRCRMDMGFDAHFLGFDGLDYDLFDIELYFRDRCLRYCAGGAQRTVARPQADLYYTNYAHLRDVPEESSSSQIAGFRQLYEAAREHLSEGTEMPGCDGAAAVSVQRVLETVLMSARQDGRPIALPARFDR
jgi:predicted dehydrogenase